MILMGQFQRFWFYSNGIVTQLIYTEKKPEIQWLIVIFLIGIGVAFFFSLRYALFSDTARIFYTYNHM